MKPGDILCLENTRFHAGEEKNDPAFVAAARQARRPLGQRRLLGRAPRARLDRRARPQAARPMPAAPCRPSSRRSTRRSDAPQRPVVAIVGGAKVSTKLDLLDNLVAKVDALIIGGAHGQHLPGRAGHQRRQVAGRARPRRHRARDPGQGRTRRAARSCCRSTPSWRKQFEANAPSHAVGVDAIAGRRHDPRHRPRSRSSASWRALDDAATLVWNGPFGAFELQPFDNGTVAVAEHAAELTKAGKLVSVAGGGDTVAALNAAGVADDFTYVSTAGGAFLEWMEGKPLPGVEVLRIK